MSKNYLNKLTSEDELSFTYVSGLGFVSIDSTRTRLRQIRRSSNMLCALTLFYFVFTHFFTAPFLRLAYLMGFDLKINSYTGLVIASKITINLITILLNSVSLFLACTCCFLLYRKPLKEARVFKKPNSGTLSVSIPICLAMSILACLTAVGFNFIFGKLGVVFPSVQSARGLNLTVPTLFIFLTSLLQIVLEEFFFRGIMVTALRRFGDGFAVVASAMVFALWGSTSMEVIYYFFIGLTLGYFLIRSGSIFTPILARVLGVIMYALLYLAKAKLDPSLTEVIVLLTVIVIFIAAFYAFLKFIKHDKNAFYLLEPNDKLTVKTKLFSFASTFFFVILAISAASRIISQIQIVG